MKVNVLYFTNLKGKKKQERLDTVKPSIYKVSHEQVIRVWDVSSYFEQFFEIIKLTMNVSAYLES